MTFAGWICAAVLQTAINICIYIVYKHNYMTFRHVPSIILIQNIEMKSYRILLRV